MALDSNKPADTDLVSSLGAYHRETRAYINSFETQIQELGAVGTSTYLSLSAGTTALYIGTDLSDIAIELIYLTSTGGASSIKNIANGRSGQIKIFQTGDNNCYFDSGGNIELNQPDHWPAFGGYPGDVIAFGNVGGNPDLGSNGTWKELFRTPKV